MLNIGITGNALFTEKNRIAGILCEEHGYREITINGEPKYQILEISAWQREHDFTHEELAELVNATFFEGRGGAAFNHQLIKHILKPMGSIPEGADTHLLSIVKHYMNLVKAEISSTYWLDIAVNKSLRHIETGRPVVIPDVQSLKEVRVLHGFAFWIIDTYSPPQPKRHRADIWHSTHQPDGTIIIDDGKELSSRVEELLQFLRGNKLMYRA